MDPAVRVIRGRRPDAAAGEYAEFQHYDTGHAEREAQAVAGRHDEPWLNVLDASEPSAQPSFDLILSRPELARHLRGAVMDVGAGTCWLSGRLTRVPAVTEVYAVDLSEQFLTTSGVRVMQAIGADLSKVTIVASDFNEIPLPDGGIDCALLFASLHHSLSPIKTLREVRRCVKPGGSVLVLESPAALMNINARRKRSLALSGDVTEIAYTRGEIEYVIANAQLRLEAVHALDVLTRGVLRLVARRLFRAAGLEAIVLNPPPYLFVCTR